MNEERVGLEGGCFQVHIRDFRRVANVCPTFRMRQPGQNHFSPSGRSTASMGGSKHQR